MRICATFISLQSAVRRQLPSDTCAAHGRFSYGALLFLAYFGGTLVAGTV